MLELVECAGLTVGGELGRRSVEFVYREIDVGNLADTRERGLDEPGLVDDAVVSGLGLLVRLAEKRVDQVEDFDVVGVASEFDGALADVVAASCRRSGWLSR